MFQTMQLLTVVLVAIAMVPALAHALEFPGKMRLNRDAYFAVQSIYYPGFTIAGIAEPAGLLASVVLLALTPKGTAGFWLTCAAVLGMIGMQIVFWIYTQPVNKLWLQGTQINNLATGFFALRSGGQASTQDDGADWRRLRDRWEFSHMARAALVFLSFLSLLLAMARRS
jgi:hypothetical protein